MTVPPLDAELIEAHARCLFDAMASAEGLPLSWGEVPEAVRVLFREYARDPRNIGRAFQ